MQLSDFNHAPACEIIHLLKQCVHIERWATNLAQQRPFHSKNQLLKAAEQLSQTWQWEEIQHALATHPRIGEKQAKAQLSPKEQGFSTQEQANITQDKETQNALLEGNLAYENKFDFIFLIRAAGRSSNDILTALQQRLSHDLATEQKVVQRELSEIALLRLTQELQ